MIARAQTSLGGALLVTLGLGSSPALGEPYWALNPRPSDELRELDPDRPDFTESPHTVDAGHVQIETDLFLYRTELDDGSLEREWEAAASVIKWGMTSWSDAQLVLEPVKWSRDEGGTDFGFGRLGLRYKMNLWGNDEGQTALGLVPFARWQREGWDGGLVVPFRVDLPRDFKLGLQGGIEVRDLRGEETVVELVESMSLNRDLFGPLGAFIEWSAAHNLSSPGLARFSLNGGLSVELDDDLRLDAGTRFGLAGEPRLREYFLGLTARR